MPVKVTFQAAIAESDVALKASNHGHGKLLLEFDKTQYAHILTLMLKGEDKYIEFTADIPD
jgi:hypothetical protein